MARYLAVDFEITNRMISHFLSDVSDDGGGALVVRGSYGQGKTFTLNCLEDVALSSNFLVMRAEADTKENRLNRPDQFYRSLMKSLRIPGYQGRGATVLINAVVSYLRNTLPDSRPETLRTWWNGRIGCRHLEWLFSDPAIESKEELVGLLANRPGLSAAKARAAHVFKGLPSDWTALSDGTLGDFTSFLLSGIGRLAKLLGKQGLIIVIDEMEKWQELKLLEQIRASSFVCGLIWAATASSNRHVRTIKGLNNNRRFYGGSPFSTVERCSVGLAIAMTPRGENEDPQQYWSKFGLLLSVDLPQLNSSKVRDYCCRIAPIFAAAYGSRQPDSEELKGICLDAIQAWKSHGERTNRVAVQSAVAAFQNWRERVLDSESAGA